MFLPGADTPDVHVPASTPCCFHNLSTQTFRNFFSEGRWQCEIYRVDFGRQMRGDKCSFRGVTTSGRVCRRRGAGNRVFEWVGLPPSVEHWRIRYCTLQASLSGTFLQTVRTGRKEEEKEKKKNKIGNRMTASVLKQDRNTKKVQTNAYLF